MEINLVFINFHFFYFIFRNRSVLHNVSSHQLLFIVHILIRIFKVNKLTRI